MTKKVLVTSYPFGQISIKPFEILKQNNFETTCITNKLKRSLKRNELKKMIGDVDYVIAGTEKYDSEILDCAKHLKGISRLGIGLDNIDFEETNKRGITVLYTPDAPSLAVAELTLGFMLTLNRRVYQADRIIRKNKWSRIIGLDLNRKTVGIIGLGRIGKIMVKLLAPFECNILVNDLEYDDEFLKNNKVLIMSKNDIYKNADIITLHIPKTEETLNLITEKELKQMKNSCVLINTSRGGIINESDIYEHLKNNEAFSVAMDVFEKEPYSGKLCELENIILTAHMGSCSENSRYLMELGAAQNIIDFVLTGKCKDIATF